MGQFKTYLLAKASLKSATDKDVEDVKMLRSLSSESAPLDHDLARMVSILLSTGMNKNDDVFLPSEILPVRATGANKPVNLDHDPTRIVGHMLRTYVTRKDGTEIEDAAIDADPSIVPMDFDITSEAVLYKYLLYDDLKPVFDLAQDGSIFVSVEAWHPTYDYLVGNKIVLRNSETEKILDPVLRFNKGPGVYKGQKVGRVLREITIGGVGIVKRPANPESVILSISRDVDYNNETNTTNNNYVICNLKDIITMNITKEELLQSAKLVRADAEAEFNSKLVAAVTPLEAKIDEMKKECEAKETELVAAKKELETKCAELLNVSAERETLLASVAGYQRKELMVARSSIMAKELPLAEDSIAHYMEDFINLSDEEFNNKVSYLKGFVVNVLKSSKMVKSDEQKVSTEGGEAQKDSSEVVDSIEVVNTGSTETVVIDESTKVVDESSAEKSTVVVEPDLEDVDIDSAEKIDVDISTDSTGDEDSKSIFSGIVKKLLVDKRKV